MNEADHLITAIKVWAAAAWADGIVVESEAMTLRAIIEVAKLSDEQRKTARRWIDSKVSLEDVEVGKIAPAERVHIFSVACGMVAFDQHIAETERGFLDRLQKALAISDADAKKAREGAGL
jgi:uncharacterized membrane protein YebE (DUF533 family)